MAKSKSTKRPSEDELHGIAVIAAGCLISGLNQRNLVVDYDTTAAILRIVIAGVLSEVCGYMDIAELYRVAECEFYKTGNIDPDLPIEVADREMTALYERAYKNVNRRPRKKRSQTDASSA